MNALLGTESLVKPSMQRVRSNSVFALIGLSILGSVVAGIVTAIMLKVLSPPAETPLDPFLGITPSQVIIFIFVVFGAPIATVLALLTLRETFLPLATFVIGGTAFIYIGLCLPVLAEFDTRNAKAVAALGAAMALLLASLYCKKRFPLGVTDTSSDHALSHSAMPVGLARLFKLTIVCIMIGYAAFAARTNPNKALVRAIAASDYAGVTEALHSGAQLSYNPYYPNNSNALGSPIVTAIKHHDQEMFIFLAERGADIDHISWQDDESPLICAARLGETEIVQYLLERGVNLHRALDDGTSAFDLAVANGHQEAANLIWMELLREKSSQTGTEMDSDSDSDR